MLKGQADLLARAEAQVVFVADPRSFDHVLASAPDALVIVGMDESTEPREDFKQFTGRDVISLDEASAETTRAISIYSKPDRMRIITVPIPAVFDGGFVAWAQSNVRPFQVSSGTDGGEETAAEGFPFCPVSPSPDEPDLEAITGDFEPEDIPEGHPVAESVPDGEVVAVKEHYSTWQRSPTEEWPEPVNLFSEYYSAPEPAANLLPDWLADYCSDWAELVGCNVGGVMVSALCGLSACIDAKLQLQVLSNNIQWRERATLWGLVLGDSSTKKDAQIASVVALLSKLDAEYRKSAVARIKDHALRMDEFQAQRKEYVSKRAKDAEYSLPAPVEPEPLEVDWFLINDYTEEGLASLLENHTRGKVFLTSEEPAIFAFDRYTNGGSGGGSGRTNALKLFAGAAHSVLRKSGAVHVPSWCASLLVASTPSSLRLKVGPDLVEDGLLQRCLINVAYTAGPSVDRNPDMAAVNNFEKCCRFLLEHCRPVNELPFRCSPDAVYIFKKFEHAVYEMQNKPLYSSAHKASLGKWSGIAPRIAFTLALADLAVSGRSAIGGQTIVDVEHMQCATDLLMNWQAPQLSAFWDSTMATRVHATFDVQLRNLAEAIVSGFSKAEHIALTDIRRCSPKWKDLSERDKAAIFAALCDAGWLRPDPTGKSRGLGLVTKYQINPRLHPFAESLPNIAAIRARRASVANRLRPE
jgi:hypothetical protein